MKLFMVNVGWILMLVALADNASQPRAQGPSATELQRVAAGDDWRLAARAYLDLAKLDPQGHALTKDQVAFLEGSGGGGKETAEHYRERMAKLALLNPKEVRPFVMRMLHDNRWNAPTGALVILTIWKDKEALPEIHDLILAKRSYGMNNPPVSAYLTIDGGEESRKEVLNLLLTAWMIPAGSPGAMPTTARWIPAASTLPGSAASKLAAMRASYSELLPISPEAESILGGIVAAEIPAEARVAMLREVQRWQKRPYLIPYVLGYGGEHIAELLGPLMDAETNLLTLGFYCKLAAGDEQKRFAPQVRHAMEVLMAQPPPTTRPVPADTRSDEAAEEILAAVAAYDLKDLTPDVQKLMGSENAAVRMAAQVAGARLAVRGTLTHLYDQLGSADAAVRARAAGTLLSIKPMDEAERAAREEAILKQLGKPSEDYAMRALPNCGGAKAAKALETILDDADAQRAVYAAWVMAQLPDPQAAQKGLRRVAIMAMFNHHVYQQGTGIDFTIAPELQFRQLTQDLNRNLDRSHEGPVRIPPDLLRPFPLEASEVEYAIRCYRLGQASREELALAPVPFLFVGTNVLSDRRSWTLDKSYLPLLEVIAKEDRRQEARERAASLKDALSSPTSNASQPHPAASMTKWGAPLSAEEVAAIRATPTEALVEVARTKGRLQKERAIDELLIRGEKSRLLALAREGPAGRGDIIVESYTPHTSPEGSDEAKAEVDQYLDFLEAQLSAESPKVSPEQAVRSIARVASMPEPPFTSQVKAGYRYSRVIHDLIKYSADNRAFVSDVAALWLGHLAIYDIATGKDVLGAMEAYRQALAARPPVDQAVARQREFQIRSIDNTIRLMRMNLDALTKASTQPTQPGQPRILLPTTCPS